MNQTFKSRFGEVIFPSLLHPPTTLDGGSPPCQPDKVDTHTS